MGWSNCHLHQYRIGRSYIGIPDRDFDMDVTDERKVYLKDIISKPKDNLIYEYDFGDSWEHKIVLEKILPLNSSESPLVINPTTQVVDRGLVIPLFCVDARGKPYNFSPEST
jgi:hypothetical protein